MRSRGLAALLALLGVLALLGPVAAAWAGGAHVIRGFGRDGTRFLHKSLPETDGVVLLGGGRALFAGGNELLALGPTGRIDRSFGTDGHAHLVAPPNGLVEGSTVTVDP